MCCFAELGVRLLNVREDGSYSNKILKRYCYYLGSRQVSN